jgi:hypothetical protein
MNIVGRFAPFQRTTELLVKLFPLTIKTNAGLPALAALGLMLISVGAGGGGVIVKGAGFDVPPPAPAVFGGVKTVTLAIPTLATSEVEICAVN